MFCTAKSTMNPCKGNFVFLSRQNDHSQLPGDSGGGFYIKVNHEWRILGVVSSSISNECNANKFVLYTNIAKYISWVKGEIFDKFK